jgi:predicted ATPase/transcriptional regulator with XRE-family HTH domain
MPPFKCACQRAHAPPTTYTITSTSRSTIAGVDGLRARNACAIMPTRSGGRSKMAKERPVAVWYRGSSLSPQRGKGAPRMATPRTLSFGELLRRYRLAAGLTLDELAERAGLSAKGIGALERGERRVPRKETVRLVADALQLPPSERIALEAAARPHDATRRTSLPSRASRVRERTVLAARRPHKLPLPPTPLLGREREMADLCALLARSNARLVSLTGPPGVGKTRLALEVADVQADDFADGAWFVPLARLADPALVTPTIARTLGLQEVSSTPIAHVLREWLRARHVLLLLDNCEQVLAGAPRVAELLAACPGLKVLVTSRMPLHLRGEREYPISPLDLPPAAPAPPSASPGTAGHQRQQLSMERLTQYAAVALFVARARDALPSFQLTSDTAQAVAQICARLDGLPLAIELAAPWVKLLSPSQLLARLERRLPLLVGGARDTDARQQTMRAALAWSEDLLSAEEQHLFRRLAVFVGGWTLEAAEAVCAQPEGAEPLGTSVLEGLGALVDQSLVQRQWSLDGDEDGDEDGDGMGTKANAREAEREGSSGVRFRLLHVVREYALERLEVSGEAEALRRTHAVYCLGLVEERTFAAWGPEATAWMGRLEQEHDNLRAALGWARAGGEVELGLRLATSVAGFWYVRGYFTEGLGWLEGLLAQEPRAGEGDAAGTPGISAKARAMALAAASNLARVQEDDERAQAAAAEALALARDQPAGWAAWVAGTSLHLLGQIAWDRGELERAAAYMEESVARLQAVGQASMAASFLTLVGLIALDRGDLERARACCEESLAFARRTGADHPQGFALACLAHVARRRGDLAGAELQGREELLVWRRLGSPSHIAGGLEGLAQTAAATASEGAQARRVARLLGAATALREQVGVSPGKRGRVTVERTSAEARLTLSEEQWAAAFAAGKALSLADAVSEALGEVDYLRLS